MTWLVPMPVAIPLIAAALVVATDHVVSRHVTDAIVISAAAAATVFAVLILVRSERHDLVYWFGGWRPDGHVALGISFDAGPLGAGMAVLACGLTTLALLYSWTFMRDAAQPYDALTLVLCAGMAGFSLTGDIFNMFVWFELIGVAAYALAGYQAQELGPVQGAVNFAISNTVAGYLVLIGIALLYGRTGALNLAQIGRDVARHPADRLVVVAFTLLVAGLLGKAAIVPFHLWHADAHAVAPIPICALFSGVMIQLGLLFVARMYWTVFNGAFPAHGAVEGVLLALGVVTMVVGALMCFLQRHLKRMLVFSTITEAGIMLSGIALLDPKSLAGTANLVLSHGLLKAGLFFACGLVVLRLDEVDELRLHGRCKGLRYVAVLWFAGSIGLIGLPYVGVFLGHSLLDDAASSRGIEWLQPLSMVAQGVAAGTLLRAGARMFLGWGEREDDMLTPEPADDANVQRAFSPLLVVVTAVALGVGLAAAVVPSLAHDTQTAAARLVGAHVTPAHGASASSIAYGIGAGLVAVAVAVLGLWYRRLPSAALRPVALVVGPPVGAIRAAHSGIVGDYLVWIVAGTVAIGSVWAFTLT